MVEAEQQPLSKFTDILNCVYCLTLSTSLCNDNTQDLHRSPIRIQRQRQHPRSKARCACNFDLRNRPISYALEFAAGRMQIHTSQYKDACTQIKNLFSFIIKLLPYLEGRSAVKFQASYNSLWQSKDKCIIIKLVYTGDNLQSDVCM